MAEPRTSVAKIGGSLLSAPNVRERLQAWLAAEMAAQPETHFILVAGGGRLVDILREIDASAHLGDEAAHEIAIELMDATTRIVAAMLPELYATVDFAELQQRRIEQPGITLFCPSQFMAEVEPYCAGTRLPPSWTVTSDSIAARLAIVLAANELVLVKSAPPPSRASVAPLNLWSEAGYVDVFLPRLAAEMPAMRVVVP